MIVSAASLLLFLLLPTPTQTGWDVYSKAVCFDDRIACSIGNWGTNYGNWEPKYIDLSDCSQHSSCTGKTAFYDINPITSLNNSKDCRFGTAQAISSITVSAFDGLIDVQPKFWYSVLNVSQGNQNICSIDKFGVNHINYDYCTMTYDQPRSGTQTTIKQNHETCFNSSTYWPKTFSGKWTVDIAKCGFSTSTDQVSWWRLCCYWNWQKWSNSTVWNNGGVKEFSEFPFGDGGNRGPTDIGQCSKNFNFRVSRFTAALPSQTCLNVLSSKKSGPYEIAPFDYLVDTLTTDFGADSVFSTYFQSSKESTGCAFSNAKVKCRVMKVNSTTESDCIAEENMYTVNDVTNKRFTAIHNQPWGYSLWVCLRCQWEEAGPYIMATAVQLVKITQNGPACRLEDLSFNSNNVDIALNVSLSTTSNMHSVLNLTDYGLGGCPNWTFSLIQTAANTAPDPTKVKINSTSGEIFIDNSKWYNGDSQNRSMHTIIATYNNGTVTGTLTKSLNITVACLPPKQDWSTYVDQSHIVRSTTQNGYETMIYDTANIFIPESNIAECPLTFYAFNESSATPTFQGNKFSNSGNNWFQFSNGGTSFMKLNLDADSPPIQQYVSIRVKYSTLTENYFLASVSRLISLSCDPISLSFSLSMSYENFVNRTTTGYYQVVEVTATGGISQQSKCSYTPWLTKNGATWNSSNNDVRLQKSSGQWFVEYDASKRYVWTDLVIHYQMTDLNELTTSAFSVRTMCPNNSVAIPPALTSNDIPSTAPTSNIEIYSIFTVYPFIHSDCPYTIDFFNQDNSPVTTNGLLYTSTNSTFIVLKVNASLQSNFTNIKIRVSNLDFGYTTTPLFTVIVKCKLLLFNTINANYSYWVPSSNPPQITTLFGLLSEKPSLNSSCPLVLSLLDSSDNVISENLTLDTSVFPYNVTFDKGTRTNLVAKIRARITGVTPDQNTTSFIVKTTCKHLAFSSVFASGASYDYVVRAAGDSNVTNGPSVLNETSPSSTSVCSFWLPMYWEGTNTLYSDTTSPSSLLIWNWNRTVSVNKTMVKSQSIYFKLFTLWDGGAYTSGVMSYRVTCALNTLNGPAISTYSNPVSIDWLDIKLKTYSDMFAFPSDELICIPKLNLYQAGTQLPIAGSNVYLNGTLLDIYAKTSLVYNLAFDVVVCYTYDCAGTQQPAMHTVNLTYSCQNTSMAFTITTPNATNKEEAWIRAFPKPLNFTINSLTSPNMANCKVLKIELVDAFGSSTKLTEFAPNPKDYTNFTWSGANPYGPIVWNMTNDLTENIYLFYAKLTFVNNNVHYLEIAGTQQLNLTVYDECKQLSQTSIGILDPTPIKVTLARTTTTTPVIALSITMAIRNKLLLLPAGCNVFRWEVWNTAFSRNLTSVLPDIVFPVNVDPKHIKAQTNNPMIRTTFKLNALTQSLQNASLDLQLKVCGFETVTIVNTSYRLMFVFQMQPLTWNISFASLRTNVSNSDSGDCPINLNQALDAGTTDLISDPAVTFDSTYLYLNLAEAKYSTFDVNFRTKGLVTKKIPFEYHICDENTFQVMNMNGVNKTLKINENNTPVPNIWALNEMKGADYGVMGVVLACIPCPTLGYYLVDEKKDPYNGTSISLQPTQIEVNTAVGFQTLQTFLKVNVSGVRCTFFPSYYVPINVQVCGFEKVTVDKPTPYVVNVTVGVTTDPVELFNSTLYDFFMTDYEDCGLNLFLADTNVGPYNLASVDWSQYTTFTNTDQKSDNLIVNHFGNIKYTTNTTEQMYVRAISNGKVEAYKLIQINYKFPLIVANATPTFVQEQNTTNSTVQEIIVENNNTQKAKNETNSTKNETKKEETKKETTAAVGLPTVAFGGINVGLNDTKNTTKKTQKQFLTQKELTPVILSINEVTRSGKVHIVFNQQMMVPAYLDTSANSNKNNTNATASTAKNANSTNSTKTNGSMSTNQTSPRKLGEGGVPLSSVNVTRDIMDIKFEFKSDVEVDQVEYTLQLVNWTTQYMDIQVNFTNPLLISKGASPDRIICKIVNLDLFRSEEGAVLQSDRVYIQNEVPRQLPKGVDEDALLKNAALAGNGMKALMFVQLVLQLFLKGALSRLWPLFFTLQIVCYLAIYDTKIPSNAEVYIAEFTKMIEFDVLNVDSIMFMITGDKNFKLLELVLGKKEDQKVAEDGKEEKTMMDDLKIYIMMGAAALGVLFIMCCLCMVCYKYRDKITKKLKETRDSFLFNGAIRSITIAYIQSCISFGRQIKDFIKGREDQTDRDKGIALAAFIIMAGYPIFSWMVVKKYKDRLDEKEIKDRISNLYQDINITGFQTGKLMYYCIFLLRRILFVAIPTFLFKLPFAEIQFLIFFTSLYLVYYAFNRPHFERQRVLIEIFNEWMILVQCYHFIIFSEMVQSMEAQFTMGYSYVACVGMTVFVNLALMVVWLISEYRRKKLEARKKWWLSQNAEIINKQLAEAKRNYFLQLYTTGVDVDLKNGFDDNNAAVYGKFILPPGLDLKGDPKKSEGKVRPGYITLLDQMAKFKRKHDTDSKGRIVKTDPHTLPEYFKEPMFKLPKLDQKSPPLKQNPKYASKLQVVFEDNREDCEDEDIVLDYKQLINDLFGDFGTFAEYNRNTFLFSYDITATLPTKQQVKEIKDARDLAIHKKQKYEQVAQIRQMKQDRAEIIDKLLQKMNSELNNNKFKTMDIKLESQKIKAANNKKVQPKIQDINGESPLAKVFNSKAAQKALAKNPEIAATLKPSAAKPASKETKEPKIKPTQPKDNGENMTKEQFNKWLADEEALFHKQRKMRQNGTLPPGIIDYEKFIEDYMGPIPPYNREREEKWEEAILQAHRDHLDKLPDTELNRQEKALNALLDKEYYEGKAKIDAMRDPKNIAKRKERNARLDQELKDKEAQLFEKYQKELRSIFKSNAHEKKEIDGKLLKQYNRVPTKTNEQPAKPVMQIKKKAPYVNHKKERNRRGSDESVGIIKFDSDDKIDENEWLKND